MISTLFDKEGHLTEDALEAFKKGYLDDESLILVSEHIANCERCASVLADSFDDNELAETPLGFEEEIQNKIRNRKQSSFQFGFYTFKVAAAACVALIIVFSNQLNFAANSKVQATCIKAPDLSITNSISTNLNNFSQKIINMEVYNNEKEKK
ncbi:MAG: hypothetical protein Q8900_12370 [Bacillota bacterium]|nr:hypothetical protein [Bacillota bacterium]